MGAAPTTSTDSEPGIPTRFFGDPDFDFEARLALGLAAQGVGDIGKVLVTLAGIEDGSADGWGAITCATSWTASPRPCSSPTRRMSSSGPDSPRRSTSRFRVRRPWPVSPVRTERTSTASMRMFDFFAERLTRRVH